MKNVLTLSWPTSERYVGWPGQGKFTLPYYLPKYLSNHHQTWHYGSVSDEDQENANDVICIFADDSKYRRFLKGHIENTVNFKNYVP